MAEPSGAINISKAMFQVDEQLSNQTSNKKLSNQLHMNLSNAKSVASWNSLNEYQGFQNQMPAFLNQTRLSNYYQDNPWPTLENSTQFGLTPMGGQLNPNSLPGRQPGNALKGNFLTGTEVNVREPSMQNNVQPMMNNGLVVPSFMGGLFNQSESNY